jgi:dynein heavy chain
MIVPDFSYVTEILLYSAGFEQAQVLAKRLVTTLDLIQTQFFTSPKSNDFGLRSIKGIIALAENFK